MKISKKSSFTLLELAITMIVGGILILALASQFVAMSRFKTALENKADPSREAYIALNHMAHVLRFAQTTTPPVWYSGTYILAASIEGGHIALIPLTTTPPAAPNSSLCYYQWDPVGGGLYFEALAAPWTGRQKIADHITYFNAVVTGTTSGYEITINLISSKGDTVTPVQTKIKVLGE